MDTTASLSFEPAQITTHVNDTFPLIVNIFTGDKATISTDVWISYNPQLVEPVLPAESGNTFDTVSAKILTPGRLYVYGLRNNQTTADPANGALATIKFKALQEGTTEFGFECSQAGKTASQIIGNDASLSNIINCDRTTSHATPVTIENAAVLGISDIRDEPLGMWTLTAGVIVLIITVILFTKYRSMIGKKNKQI